MKCYLTSISSKNYNYQKELELEGDSIDLARIAGSRCFNGLPPWREVKTTVTLLSKMCMVRRMCINKPLGKPVQFSHSKVIAFPN